MNPAESPEGEASEDMNGARANPEKIQERIFRQRSLKTRPQRPSDEAVGDIRVSWPETYVSHR
ncbi:MAG: hypothetical protein IKA75_04225 [Bacteroidaceae bacterium]|nr:hypothetical protein [Bacteroidaceae bacterium]